MNHNPLMKHRLLSFICFLIYLGLTALPLAIAAQTQLNHRPWLDELSSAMAMLAFNIILLEFLTSGKIAWLSKWMGISWVLQIHQLFSRTAILFLLGHPFLYSLPSHPSYAPGPPTDSYLGMSGSTLTTGLLGLLTLGTLVGLAITRKNSKTSYESWRASHAIMALITASAGLHHTLYAGRYAQESWVMHYWQSAFSLALMSLIWVYVIQPIIQKSHPYQVASIKQLAYNIWELKIRGIKHNTHLNYQAGQFVWLKLKNCIPLYENPFSISSAPNSSSSELTFIIKDLGDFTHRVTELKSGDKVYVSQAYGNFGRSLQSNIKSLEQDTPIVLIAGGIGIAPMVSLLKQLTLTHHTINQPIHLIYGNRIENQIIDLSTLIDLHAFKQLTITYVISEPSPNWKGLTGTLDQITLKRVLNKTAGIDSNTQYLICGAAEMIDSVEYALSTLSVNANQIDSEKFQYDLSQKTARTRDSLIRWGMGTITLIASAIYFLRL
jgi:predicted ferric reductase